MRESSKLRTAVLERAFSFTTCVVFVLACNDAPTRQSSQVPNDQAVPSSSIASASTEVRPPESSSSFEGRPIAPTMSWYGADWLVRPERDAEEDPATLHRELAVKPGQTACDIGAGNGFHSLRLAVAVGPRGRVLAVDLQPEMLALLRTRATEAGVTNIETIQADTTDPHLPPRVCDLELLVDVYHELADPEAVLAKLRDALSEHGRIAIVEFRAEDPLVPIKPEHKMTKAQVLRELELRGFRLVYDSDKLPWQHLLIFERAFGRK